MIWVGLAAVAALGMLPLLLALRRAPAPAGRRQAELALHRARLAELDRDFAEGRIAATAHAAARTEVARRLLAADAAPEVPARPGTRTTVLFLAALVPLGAGALYLVGGAPGLPSVPVEEQRQRAEAERALLGQLRARVAQTAPASEQHRQGLLLIGGMELGLGNLGNAIEAWRDALAMRFDARLALDLAEVLTIRDRTAGPEAMELAQRALAAPDLPPELRSRAARLSAGS